MNWEDELEEFRTYLRLERGLTVNSVKAYSNDIMKLVAFMEENGGVVSPESVTAEMFRDFICWLGKNGISPRTQARILSGVRSFYKNLIVAETSTDPEKTDTKAVDKQENRAYIDVQEILPRVSADEAAVLRQLESGKQPVDRMIDETQLPAGRVLSALTLLEVKGFVKRLPARYYELAKK